jgi:hypothetical protein
LKWNEKEWKKPQVQRDKMNSNRFVNVLGCNKSIPTTQFFFHNLSTSVQIDNHGAPNIPQRKESDFDLDRILPTLIKA